MSTEVINTKNIKNISKRKQKPKINTKKENRDIILIVLALYIIGTIFILSSSSANLVASNADPFYFLKKQILFGLVSIIPMCIAYFINIKYITRKHRLVFITSIIVLILVMLVGKEVKGNRNWLSIGALTMQPSEFIKISLILCMSACLKEQIITLKEFKKTLIVMVTLCGFIVIQKDLGTVVIMGAVAMFLLFIAGTPFRILGTICLVSAGGLVSAIMVAPYRMQRVLIFMNPFNDYYGMGYQTIQSLYAIANGGTFGRGLYESVQKYGFLPENHTDFIFSIVVEEVGLIGAIVLISLFILLITKIFKIAYSLKNKEETLIASGIGCMIAIEALMNLSVTVSLMPIAGVTLPFISYGGSSLMAKATAIALVLNINKNCGKIDEGTVVKNKKEDSEYTRKQVKKVKQRASQTKKSIMAKIKKIMPSSKSKRTKTTIPINTEEKDLKQLKIETEKRKEIEKDSNATLIENKKIEKKELPQFNIPNVKIDIKNIINKGTSTKTKVVTLDKTTGLKKIKIKKKH